MNARKLEAPDVSRVANSKTGSWYEASARQRVRLMLDAGSFQEFIGPEQREQSPHLRVFDLPTQFDDGIVVGRGRIAGTPISLLLRRGASWAAPSARFTAPS
ncbi:acetyl-CoA carboxylase beta subunit [Bradyrhizobium sp. AZCC 2289]